MGIFAGAIDYFQRGGACMWPLLLCSIAAIAMHLRQSKESQKSCGPLERSGLQFSGAYQE